MIPYLHQCILLFTLALIAVPSLADSEKPGDKEAADLAAILEEAEATADWAADPLADLGFYGEDLSVLIITSARAGIGHSNNFLKGKTAVSSGYYQVEADAWLSWFFERSTLTAMFFGEASIYENIEGLDVDDEFLTFGQVSWSLQGDSTEFGIEALTFYADQVYDATLTINGGAASGTRIQQFRPQGSVYLDWFPGRLDRLRLEVSTLRAKFDIEDQDYWEPILTAEWERLWKKSITTRFKAEASRQYYDDEIGRKADGTDQEDERPLLVNRLFLEERLTWKPQRWKWMEWTATVGVSWDDDQTGVYEDMRRSTASARARISGDWGQLRLTGRWMEIRYRNREPLTRHTQKSLDAEYKLPLPGSFAAYLRGQWTSLNSTIDSEEFSEQRGELLFEWSY
jgi:hypothetical protein